MKHKFAKTLCLVLCLVLAMAPSFSVGALAADDSGPAVRVNGSLISFPDGKPFIDSNGRTMIPVRAVTEALGAAVSWDGDTRTVTIARDGTTVEIQIDSPELTVSTEKKSTSVRMDTAAVIQDGRTYVPIRFVAEALGAAVDYSDVYRTVGIWSEVLTAEQLSQLQAYPHTAPEYAITYAQGQARYDAENLAFYFGDRSGFGVFANAREHLYHAVSGKGSYGFPGLGKKLSDADPDTLFRAVVDEAAAEINYESERLTVRFLTDASCLYQGEGMDRLTACVRGVAEVQLHVPPTELEGAETALLCSLGFDQLYQNRMLYHDADIHMNTQPGYAVNIHTIVPLGEAY